MERLDAVLGRVLIPLVTPFKDDGAVDWDTLADLTDMVIERGFCDSVIVGGTTGEFISLSFEERLKLIQVVHEAAANRVAVVAGTGAAYTQHAVALTRAAEEIGCTAVMVVTPYYLQPTQDGLYRHYKTIAEATKLPIMLYNIPLFSGVNIEPKTLAALAEIPNIRAIKEEAGINPTQASEYALVVPQHFAIYCGDDTMTLEVLTQGGCGVVSGGSQVIGDRVKKAIASYMAGNVAAAAELHLGSFRFFQALNQNGRVNPIPLLRDAISMTWRPVGPPRLPLLPGTAAERAVIRDILTDLGVKVRR